jgi:hypothetical protein
MENNMPIVNYEQTDIPSQSESLFPLNDRNITQNRRKTTARGPRKT